MKNFSRTSALLAGTALALVAVTEGRAQTAGSPPDAAASGAPAVNEVVVTGSRLRTTVFTAPTPVTTVGAAAVQESAVAAVGDLVNELPAFRDSSGPTQNQRNFPGSGQNTLDLRGLGTVRTLVLVDGERFTPSQTTGTIDTNMIPTGLVDRIDVVTGGASAAYGSDAVAGVVNFVLKKNIEGIQGTIQYGASQYGDSREPYISLAGGASFAGGKGHLMFGIDASQNSGVGTIYTRPWGAEQPGLVVYGTGRAAGVPSEGFAENVTYSAQTAGGLITSGPLKGIAFSPGGVPYNFQYGTVLSNLMTGGSNPGLNPFGNWNLEIPTKRETAMGRVDYDLTSNTHIYAEFNIGDTGSFGQDTFQQNAFTINSGNPFIPASIQAAMTADGLSTIAVGRVLTETGGLHQHDTIETFGGRVGITGEVFGNWDWDASYQRGQTNFYLGVTGATNLANYNEAIDVVTGPNGVPICGPVATNPNLNAVQKTTVQPNCVPFNVFGAGSPSAGALAYISGTAYQESTMQQQVLDANLKGSPFATWAGPIQTAVGFEYRTEGVSATADPVGLAAGWGTNNGGAYSGTESVIEGYGEADVPLAKDMAFAKSLNLNLAIRETHYSLSGSVTTWKVGMTYEPTSEIRLRATQSHDIRAPNVSELFASTGSSINTASSVNPINGQTGALFTSSQGNPNLLPETSDTTAFGVAYRPSFVPGFTASIDLYNINIHNEIGSVSATQIETFCAQGQAAYCSLITFNNTPFGIANVATSPLNLSGFVAQGFDLEFDYRVPMPEWLPGGLNFRALGTHVIRETSSLFGVSTNSAGTVGTPYWKWFINGNYTLGRFSTNIDVRYQPASIFSATLIGPGQAGYSSTLTNSIADNTFPTALYFNLGASYDLVHAEDRQLQIYGEVNNLLNTQPPAYAAIGINSGGNPYDLVGRVFKIGARFKY